MGKYVTFVQAIVLGYLSAIQASADPKPVAPSPRAVALAAFIAEDVGRPDYFKGIPPEDRPPARLGFQPILTGMYGPSSPFVSDDGVMRPSAVGGLMVIKSKGGMPVAQIDGVTYPGLNSSYGLITIKDKLVANGKVFTGDEYYLVSHEHRLKVYRHNLNGWAAIEGYSWAHFASLGTLNFNVSSTQVGSGFGIGVSFRPSENAVKRGTLFQISASGGPAARFGTEQSGPVQAAAAGFLNLSAVY